jgi:integrase
MGYFSIHFSSAIGPTVASKEASMAMKRGNGEGSVYMRGDGRWYGAITLGVNAQGRPNRKTVSGKTCTEVVK